MLSEYLVYASHQVLDDKLNCKLGGSCYSTPSKQHWWILFQRVVVKASYYCLVGLQNENTNEEFSVWVIGTLRKRKRTEGRSGSLVFIG